MRRWFRVVGCCLISLVALFALIYVLISWIARGANKSSVSTLNSTSNLPKRSLTHCTYFTCFNASKCAFEYTGQSLNRISIYVYPQVEHVLVSGRRVSLGCSRQQIQLLRALRTSRYIVNDPLKACVFVPSIDLLNGLSSNFARSLQVLSTLPWWNGGVNHLLFGMLRGKYSVFSGQAIMAHATHSKWTYRPTFDVSIPAYNPLYDIAPSSTANTHILTVLPVANTDPATIKQLLLAYRIPTFPGNASVLVVDPVLPPSQSYGTRNASVSISPYDPPSRTVVDYGEALAQSLFCLIIQIPPVGQFALFDSMNAGCIPVIADDNFILPFSEVLDWSKIAIRVRHSELYKIVTTLTSLSSEEIAQFRRQVKFVFNRYFSTIDKIVHTTLDIINDRVFPYYARSYVQWNSPDYVENALPPPPLLFYPPRSSVHCRLTALIRARDHFGLLHQLLLKLQLASSLHRIVVLWTNPKIPIPNPSLWPALRVPLTVLPFGHLILGRYYPFAQIDTEAVLSLDDSTCLPDLQQIQAGFELWCHNPDRLIGLTNSTIIRSAQKASDETSFLSAVFGLTIFHKHYLHSYAELLSSMAIRPVNQTGACEELLMNWLIIQLSGRPVLTVRDSRLTPVSPASCHLQSSMACWDDLSATHPYFTTILSRGRAFRIAPFTVSSFD
ncbi:hypothetical protein CRM22_004259 [Opisthorchis felineus]|uniref:Exostosin GT47 domain-containing protein n=1 Tax=Opisthorchis felineus TaxID=147828 RepID=A0A4S2LX17_OPIFE|nr:hypothetical protein CRM22_004259 [Opisthorchis felineus]TGZ68422.1 hypothetical protein CRM22_004259 [Opisthorchis felineus]